jgi:hypothetical protein
MPNRIKSKKIREMLHRKVSGKINEGSKMLKHFSINKKLDRNTTDKFLNIIIGDPEFTDTIAFIKERNNIII